MKFNAIISLFCAIVLLFSVDNIAAQTKSKPPAPASNYIMTPFDADIEKLPPNFLGHNGKQIYESLQSRKFTATKDEFETTEQFNRRVQSASQLPLFGKVSTQSLLALKLERFDSKYDADQSILQARLFTTLACMSETITPLLNCFTQNWEVSSSEYLAQNIFGVKFKVKKVVSESIELNIVNYEKLQLKEIEISSEKAVTFDIPMDMSKARNVKENLKALIIGELTYPYISSSGRSTEGTITSPTDVITTQQILRLKVLQLWLYDFKTGEILKKIKYENS